MIVNMINAWGIKSLVDAVSLFALMTVLVITYAGVFLRQERDRQHVRNLLNELKVLNIMVQGAASKEIALRLNITERTVKSHVSSIFNKLEGNSRTEAVAYALPYHLAAGDEQA